MAVRRRGKMYWIDVIGPNGKRIRKSTGTSDLKAAQEYHDTLKAGMWRVTRLGEKQRRTWAESVVKWLEETSHKADHQRDKQKLRRLHSQLGGLYLDQINRGVVDNIITVLRKEGLAVATMNRYLAVVRAILMKARDEWEWVDKIPKVRMFNEPARRVEWLTREQASKLLKVLPTHLRAMVQFSLATGLRQSNVTGLLWSQVDMDRQVAWIHPDQAKAGKAISVPLNSVAMAVLSGEQGKHSDFVFTYRGLQIKCSNNTAWKRALREVGLEGFRWHGLRHTWASWHAQAGTPMHTLQEMGGWASPEMVRRYAHLGAEHLATHADRICHNLGTP